MKSNIIDLPEFREQTHVFKDRTHAGRVLAEMLAARDTQDGIILAIPAGGVPVGVVMAEATGLDFDVTVVSKITLPWNTEAGYGAVAYDFNIGKYEVTWAQYRAFCAATGRATSPVPSCGHRRSGPARP